MIFSVWNPGARRYDYFDVASKDVTGPTHLAFVPQAAIGIAADDAAWTISGGRRIGSGVKAKGRIGTFQGPGGLGDVELPSLSKWMKLGLVAVGIYLVTR